MRQDPEVAVTVSGSLYRQLLDEARRLGVPLKWLVAALVAEATELAENQPEVLAC